VGRTHFKAQTVSRGGFRGGAPGARPPKIGKKYYFILFLSKLFRIMQHRDIFIFNFKTMIRVFRFINCFPFLIPKELTKYQAK
jgi:hypothetical protein